MTEFFYEILLPMFVIMLGIVITIGAIAVPWSIYGYKATQLQTNAAVDIAQIKASTVISATDRVMTGLERIDPTEFTINTQHEENIEIIEKLFEHLVAVEGGEK